MNNDNFFVVLPSDSSMKVYPDNKLSKYTTNIPNEIQVDPSKWEVALQEIQFPHSWYNIRKEHNVIVKMYRDLLPKEMERLEDIHKADMNVRYSRRCCF